MDNSAMLGHLPMRVLALNQYYAPDASATAQLLTDLCEDLVKAGDEVRVVASRVQGDRRLPAHECIDGVEVVRPWSTGYGKSRLTYRFLDDLSFVAAAASRACVVARPDVILALSAPPMVATAAALAARGRELPLVHWVHDVYPDIALATGVLPRRSALGSTLQILSRMTHRHAAMSIAVSSKMAEILKAHGQSADRVRVQENWADGTAIQPRPAAATSFRARHGLKGRFVVMYSGNLGLVHDIATPIRAAHELSSSCPDVVFVFVGAGARLAEARALAGEAANIRFLPAQPRGELSDSLAAANLHLVSLAEGMEGLVVPSKLYGVMAAGRPVVYIGPAQSEVAHVVRRHELGWRVDPGDAAGLAAIVADATRRGDDLAACGERARRRFVERHERAVATTALRGLLLEAANLRVQ